MTQSQTPRSLLLSLLLLGSLSAPVAAQEEGELYLLEGRDQVQGDFTGRLVLQPAGADAYRVDRQVQFSRTEQSFQGGRGQRLEWRLRVRFEQVAGLSGAIRGREAGESAQMRVEFEEGGLISTSFRGAGTLSQGQGYPVRTIEAGERPATTGPSYEYRSFRGVAFLRGEGDEHEVDLNDVAQGGLGDCYFMAGLAAVARTDPHRIRSMIETNPDGTFTVYLWKHDYQWGEEVVGPDGMFVPRVEATRVVVDDTFPTTFGTLPSYGKWGDTITGPDGGEVHELWPMILEKAYAQHLRSYPALEGGVASTAMSFFSGEDAVVDYELATQTEAELSAVLRQATERGYPVTLGVPEHFPALSLVGNHYYFLAGLDDQGRAILLNPWGSRHPPRALTMAELKAHIDVIHVGEF
jgi:Calpain family cysteine protease